MRAANDAERTSKMSFPMAALKTKPTKFLNTPRCTVRSSSMENISKGTDPGEMIRFLCLAIVSIERRQDVDTKGVSTLSKEPVSGTP